MRQKLQGIDPACWRMFLLLDACEQAAARCQGVDIAKLVNMRNKDKKAPLDGVVLPDLIHMLLTAGANPERSLAYLPDASDLRAVDILIGKRANINVLKEGRTAQM